VYEADCGWVKKLTISEAKGCHVMVQVWGGKTSHLNYSQCLFVVCTGLHSVPTAKRLILSERF
jgi:hypothetical protein